MARREPAFVYFVRRADGEGPVKIGCSRSPVDRMGTLMSWSPYPLAILATLPGDETLERRFHNRFRDQHCHREWFRHCDELQAVIDAIAAGTFDVATLPEARGLPSPVRKPWTEEQKLGVRAKRALERARRDGVAVPNELFLAINRWGAGEYSGYYDPANRHSPEDRKLIVRFLGERAA